MLRAPNPSRSVIEHRDDTLVIGRKNGAHDHASVQMAQLESVLLDQISACPALARLVDYRAQTFIRAVRRGMRTDLLPPRVLRCARL